jgi:hypothetical protein
MRAAVNRLDNRALVHSDPVEHRHQPRLGNPERVDRRYPLGIIVLTVVQHQDPTWTQRRNPPGKSSLRVMRMTPQVQ